MKHICFHDNDGYRMISTVTSEDASSSGVNNDFLFDSVRNLTSGIVSYVKDTIEAVACGILPFDTC